MKPTPHDPDEEQPEEGGPPVPPPPAHLVAPEAAAGLRLDTWLARLPGAPSRNRVQQLVKDGHVLVNGAPAKRSHEMVEGEVIDINWPTPADDWPWPQDIPLDIVHEDEHVIVINKQANLVVHPSAGNPDGTLVNALLHHFPNLPGINGVRRPGIVHRIDRDTTGLMVVAKTERAMTSLSKQLQNRTVSRRYLALAIGDPAWNEIRVEAAVGRDPQNRLKRSIDGAFPRQAISHFTVLRRAHVFTLIGCKLETGRTHQIRIHLKHIGHPIICDNFYDGHLNRCLERLKQDQHELRRAFTQFDRPWLHAHTLEFQHPAMHGKVVRFQVPPPDDARALLHLIFGPDVEEICGERRVEV